MDPFRHLTGAVSEFGLVLSAVGPVQIELVDDVQALGRLRIEAYRASVARKACTAFLGCEWRSCGWRGEAHVGADVPG